MKNLIFILFIAFATNIYSQEKTCTEFKTGKFKYANPKYAKWEITRNDSVQIETNTKTGLEIYNAIDWKTDCEFVLTCYKVLNAEPTKFVGKVFYINITKTFTDGYFCVAENDAIEDMHLKVLKVD